MGHFKLAIKLAYEDMRYEYPFTLTLICAVATLTLPMLLLQGIHNGVISGMLREINSDPSSRELIPLGQEPHDSAFFDQLSEVDGVQFLMPATRFLATPLKLEVLKNGDTNKVDVAMIPSGINDPLLGSHLLPPESLSTIVISTPVAERLNVGIGDRLIADITRLSKDSSYESLTFHFTVSGITQLEYLDEMAVLLSPEFVYETELYREHIASSLFGTSGYKRTEVKERKYSSFRLYAADIGQVEALRQWLIEQGVRSSTKINNIKLIERLDDTFSKAVTLLTVGGGIGLMGTLGCVFWLNIKKKKRELSVLLVLGLTPFFLNVFTQFQAIVISTLAVCFSILIYAVSLQSINEIFTESFGGVKVFLVFNPVAVIMVMVTTILIMMIAALIASMQIMKIEAGEGLRDE